MKTSAVRVFQNKTVLAWVAVVILFAVSCVMAPSYLSRHYIVQLLSMASILGFVAIGQNLVIISGGTDMSVAYAVNLAAVIMTSYSQQGRGGIAPLIVLAVGALAGAINGFFVAFVKVPSIITTLSMGCILTSATYLYTGGTPVGSSPQWLSTFVNSSFAGLTGNIYLWIGLIILITILLTKTTFGRKLYIVGSNQTVAELSGISSRSVLFATYVIAGISYALAGIVAVGYNTMSFLGMGDSYLMASITAVVIGGTSILGGSGSYIGTVAGVLIVYILTSILSIINIHDAGKNIIYGAVILIVLVAYGRNGSSRRG